MSKRVIIGIVAGVVLVVGGAGIYGATRNDSDSSTSIGARQDSNNPEFAPQSTSGQTFEATFSGGKNAAETRSTMTKDANGNFKLVTKTGGTNAEFYFVDNQYVSCSAGRCVKISNSETINSSTKQYEYSSSDIEAFRNNAKYQGKADCSSGTCDKWTAEKEGATSTFLIDDQGRINQVSGKKDDTTFQVDFTYKEVPTITLPDNVTEIPINIQDLQR